LREGLIAQTTLKLALQPRLASKQEPALPPKCWDSYTWLYVLTL
jgi:hypothetical protein